MPQTPWNRAIASKDDQKMPECGSHHMPAALRETWTTALWQVFMKELLDYALVYAGKSHSLLAHPVGKM